MVVDSLGRPEIAPSSANRFDRFEGWVGRAVGRYKALSIVGSIMALLTPLGLFWVVAWEEQNGMEHDVRQAISNHHDIAKPEFFYMPLTLAAVLLIADGFLTPRSSWWNVPVGASLGTLVFFNADDFGLLHSIGVWGFFGGSFAVMIITAILGLLGHRAGYQVNRDGEPITAKILFDDDQEHEGERYRGLLAVALIVFTAVVVIGHLLDWYRLLWLQWAAMLAITAHFVMNAIAPFPYHHWNWSLNPFRCTKQSVDVRSRAV